VARLAVVVARPKMEVMDLMLPAREATAQHLVFLEHPLLMLAAVVVACSPLAEQLALEVQVAAATEVALLAQQTVAAVAEEAMLFLRLMLAVLEAPVLSSLN
jgi:hypothetical protein